MQKTNKKINNSEIKTSATLANDVREMQTPKLVLVKLHDLGAICNIINNLIQQLSNAGLDYKKSLNKYEKQALDYL
jgi:hypothetical protein